MTHLVVGDDLALFVAHDPVLLLLTAHGNQLKGLEEIILVDELPVMFYRVDGRLVDNVGQIRSHQPGGCQGQGLQIHGLIHGHILGVHLQGLQTSLHIRAVHDDPPVKTSRSQQRLVQHLRPVGGRKYQKPLGSVKAVHLRQKLIQRLLPLVVSAAITGISALSDGVDLVDKNNAGRLLLGFLEQIPDTGRAHANEHLHKVGAGQREEGHARLSRHRLGQQRLTGSRRAHEKRSLGQLRSDLSILSRVVQKVHHFLQGFLRLILPGHILEGHAGTLLHIDLGVGFAHAHGPAAHALHHIGDQHKEENQRNGKAQDIVNDHRRGVGRLAVDIHIVLLQQRQKILVVDIGSVVSGLHPLTGSLIVVVCRLLLLLGGSEIRVILQRNLNTIPIKNHGLYLILIDQFQELGIGNLLGAAVAHPAVNQACNK